MDPRETLVRIVLVALLIYSLASLTAVGWELRQSELLLAELQGETESLRAANTGLERKIAEGQSPEEMQQLARERLGLVLPGEKLFYFSTDREG